MGILFKKDREKLKELKIWDILIVTLIMFYSAIMSSTEMFFATDSKSIILVGEISPEQNYSALIFQGILLIIAFLYLKMRNFDFSQWKFKINIKSVIYAILLYIFVSLIMDIFFYGYEYVSMIGNASAEVSSQVATEGANIMDMFSIPSVMYALLNGFYEEIYFIGICLSVKPENRKYYFLFSLLIRFSFHTYQGIVSALGIGLVLGIIYYLLYTKYKKDNLFLYIFSHAIADVIGLGIVGYFL